MEAEKKKELGKFLDFRFHGEYTEEERMSFSEAQQEDAVRIIGVLYPGSEIKLKIAFEVFDDSQEKQEADPLHSRGRAAARYREMTVYRVWNPKEDPHFPHEITHLVAHTLAEPYEWEVELPGKDGEETTYKIDMLSTSFMQEGLAIALDEIQFKRLWKISDKEQSVDAWMKEHQDEMEGITSLSNCINFEGFNSYEDSFIVPFSASLSKFLIERYGIELYKQMYSEIKETNLPADNVSIIETVYGRTEKELLLDWKESLL